jgi:beta-xylosidase
MPVSVKYLTKKFLEKFFKLQIGWRDVWSIGIYQGQSPVDLTPTKTINNPVLTERDITDVNAEFVADPFMIRNDRTWYMFFEVFDESERKGKIGLATSQDGYNWTYQKIILNELFHLSYPYVFEWDNDYYMIPESCRDKSIRLYKAVNFPLEWNFVTTLLEGKKYVDSSIFYLQGYWWLLTSLPQSDVLYLYHSKTPIGPWNEHPKSPIIEGDKRIARSGGRVVILDESIIRYTQDCRRLYGEKIRAFEITELTPTTYQEKKIRESPILEASGSKWNKIGMHHVDPHQVEEGRWIACVDGHRKYLKIKIGENFKMKIGL